MRAENIFGIMGETCGKCNVSDISDSIHLIGIGI